jgi:hypothetical protein
MKLKDQFNDLVPKEFGGMQEPLLTNCVDVAEDFAIGFAEWITYNAYKESTCWRMYDKKDNEYTIQKLIHEYKK